MISQKQPVSEQLAENKRRGKRKHIGQISRIAQRVIPEEFAECGDVQRIADEWNLYPSEVRDVVLADLARKVAQMERAGRVVPIRTGRAA